MFIINGEYSPLYPLPQDGQQYVHLAYSSSLSQAFTVSSPGSYVLTWFDSTEFNGPGNQSPYSVAVIDGMTNTVASTNLDANASSLRLWTQHSIEVTLAPDTYTLRFEGNVPESGEGTDIDNVSITVALATYIVTVTNDSGAGSLRQAIVDANASAGTSRSIAFNIPGGGVKTIAPLSPLPSISEPVTIDGYTQPGTSTNTLTSGNNAVLRIALDGAGAGGMTDGLVLHASNCVVRGLVINRFGGNGILIEDTRGCVIEGNFIGTGASGTNAAGNTLDGVVIFDAANNRIAGNVICGNGDAGVFIEGQAATSNRVEGNFIGVDVSGGRALANDTGVLLDNAPGNTIGGTSPSLRNVISANFDSGLQILGDGASNNIVSGNFIGTDVTGTLPISNSAGVVLNGVTGVTVGGITAGAGNLISGNQGGLHLANGSSSNLIQGNRIGTDVTGFSPLGNIENGIVLSGPNNIVGGTVAGARNIISGNGTDGIRFDVPAATGNQVRGNFIGTDITGTNALGNGRNGVWIASGMGNFIGGTTAGAGNVLSANVQAGLRIETSSASGNQIQGNFIGTDTTGTRLLGNVVWGVVINDAPGNAIGGTAPGSGNVIKGNGERGVLVTASGSTNNAVRGNSIFANGGLGIDLGGDGVTPNDPGDVDGSPNHLQNFPVLTAAATLAAATAINGTLNSTANTTFRVEFFASAASDPSGYGEGQLFLGATNVTTDNTGNVNFTASLTPAAPAGWWITATATDPLGNTSEFSQATQVPPDCTPPSGLAAWWRGEYSTVDSAGTNNGTLINGAGFTSGKAGYAFNFDGVNDYVSIPDSPTWDFGANDLTIEMWVKLAEFRNTMFIHQQSGASVGGFEFHFNSGGGLVFGLSPTEPADSGNWIPQTNVWYHLAVTRSNHFFRIFVNGEQIPNSGHFNTNSIANVTGIVRLGGFAAGGYELAGAMDEVSVYNRALSGTELQALYAANGSGKCVAGPLFTAVQGGGTVGKSPAKANYFIGDSVTLTATTNRYHRFVQWSDGNTNKSRTVTIGATNSFTAIFTNTVPLEEVVIQQWDRSFGGTSNDALSILAPTSDGGSVLAGFTSSGISGNKTTPGYGGNDLWVVRVDAQGNWLWDQTLGGSGEEFYGDNARVPILQTPDGGFILGGISFSAMDGNKTSTNYGNGDYWVVRLDASGAKLWDHSYGGANNDFMTCMAPASDGGFLLGGWSASDAGGTKTTQHYGGYDFWVVRVDAGGNQLWDRTYGGTSQDQLLSLEPTADGGFILSGRSISGAGGTKTSPNLGGTDFWVVRVDANGNQIWDRSLGGSLAEEGFTTRQTADGGFIVAGPSRSTDGTRTAPNFGVDDFWLVRLNADGAVLWDKSYGGTATDGVGTSLQSADGGFILGGLSISNPGGNKTSPHFGGEYDFWLVRADAGGQKLWDRSFGSTGFDSLASLKQTTDGGLILGGVSHSGIGDTKTAPNYGGADMWLVKLAVQEVPVGTPVILVNGQSYPNNSAAITNASATVTLQSTFTNAHIFFTLDGSSPNSNSIPYLTNFAMTASATLRAIAYSSDYAQSVQADPFALTLMPPFLVAVQGGGSVTRSPNLTNYTFGQSVTLTATNSRYYRFLQWSDGNTNAQRIVTAGFSNTFVATFTSTVPLETLAFKQWDRSFGGVEFDNYPIMRRTLDGGCVLAGATGSGVGGNKTTPLCGDAAAWIVKLDADGNKQWEQSVGASGSALYIVNIVQTADGGYALGASSTGGVSPVTDNCGKTSANFGGYDIWLVRLDAMGQRLWDRSFGGSGTDTLGALGQAADGGFLLSGGSDSTVSGNKSSPNFGGRDMWIVRTDADGNKLWDQSFGGSSDESAHHGLALLADSGFVAVGSSSSGASGTKTSANYGLFDLWVVRCDSTGNKLWDRSFGGAADDFGTDLALMADGGLVLVGESQSGVTGNKTTPNYGDRDYWGIRCDGNGNKLWDGSFGGEGYDSAYTVQATADGGVILSGESDSGSEGNKSTPSFGSGDGWVVRLDATGNKLWECPIGGAGYDYSWGSALAADGGFAFAGGSDSDPGGNKTAPHFGSEDFWLVKMFEREAPVGAPAILVNGRFHPTNSITVSTSAVVEIQTSFTNGAIYYTLDGSDPAIARLTYSEPFMVTESVTIRALALSADSSQLSEADPVLITVEAAPSIIAQPESQTAVVGDTVTLALSASGTAPLSYQWYSNQTNRPGATSATLALNNVTTNQAGNYFVIVSNAFGMVTSAVANLVVLRPPGTVTGLPGSTNVAEGGSVTFSVTASGTAPFTFQWRKNGVNLSGATNSTLTITNVQINDGGSYSVLVANAAGALVAGPVLLVVTVNPVQPNDFFTNRVAISGMTNTVSGTNTGASKEMGEPEHAGRIGGRSVWYTWQAPATGIARFRTTGSTFDTLLAVYRGTNVTNLVTVASDEDRGGFLSSEVRFNATNGVFYHIAIDGFGGSEGNFVLRWELATGTNTLPEIVLHPTSRTVLAGSPTTFTVVARPAPLTYQWLSNAVPITGATGTNYTIASVLPSHVAVYSVLVSNTTRSVESERAILEIGPFADVQSQDKPDEPPLPPAGGGGGFSPGLAKKPIASATSSSSASVAVGSVGQQILVDLFTNHLADCTLPIGCETNNTGVRFFDLTPAEPAVFVVDTAGCAARTLMWICQFDPLHRSDPKEFIDCDMESAPDGRSQVRFSTQLGKGYRVWIAKLDNIAGTVPLNWKLGVAPILSGVSSNLFVRQGGTALLSLVASNWIASSVTNPIPPPIVQWFFQGSDFRGAGVPLTLTNVDLGAAGRYTVVASNSIGVVITNVTLVVGEPPKWVLAPADRCVQPGASVLLRTDATNGPYLGTTGLAPPTYQWYLNSQPLAGKTQSELSLTNLQSDKAGPYSIVASNRFGTLTNTARVGVGLPPVIVSAPASQFVRLGDTAALSVSATNGMSAGLPLPLPPLGYQWYLNGAPLLGATGSTLNLGIPQLSAAGLYSVAVVVSDCFGDTSVAASVGVVNAQASAPVIPGEGQSALFSVEFPNLGCNSSFQWRLNGTNLPGATSPTLHLASVQQPDAGHYTLAFSNCVGSGNLFVASLAQFEILFGANPAGLILRFPPANDPMCGVVLESAFNLTTNQNDWQPVLSSTNLSGTFMIPFDPGGTPRFYRAHLVPCPP